MRKQTLAAAAAVIGVFLATAPAADPAQPVVTVKAEGNVFTGGLQFDPASVTVHVGDDVRWVNTDNLVPHTATEDHGLWDLTGTYGATPANPPGFGPGETRDRVFEAGTAHYYCKVHPQQMHGVVAVPVSLSPVAVTAAAAKTRHHLRHNRRHRHRTANTIPPPPAMSTAVEARWASGPPATGEVFDVQRQLNGGAWQPWRTGTTAPSSTFTAQPGETWGVRARLRKANDANAATDWSPVVSISG